MRFQRPSLASDVKGKRPESHQKVHRCSGFTRVTSEIRVWMGKVYRKLKKYGIIFGENRIVNTVHTNPIAKEAPPGWWNVAALQWNTIYRKPDTPQAARSCTSLCLKTRPHRRNMHAFIILTHHATPFQIFQSTNWMKVDFIEDTPIIRLSSYH